MIIILQVKIDRTYEKIKNKRIYIADIETYGLKI